MKSNLRIGLLSIGGLSWMGGVHDIHTLVKAMHQIPVDERPQILLFVSKDALDQGLFDTLHPLVTGGLRPAPIPSPRFSRTWFRHKLTDVTSGAKRRQPWLQDTLQKAGVDVLFPVKRSLGDSFRPSWMAWIPDLQYKHYPENFSEAERLGADQICDALSSDAARLIVKSKATQFDVEKFFPKSIGRISLLPFRTVPEADWYSGNPEAVLQKYELPSKFLFTPNQFWMHKNHKTAFEAIHLLREHCEDAALVCTGATEDYRNPEFFPQFQRWIKEQDLEKNIRILGLVPREDFIQLFRAATAVIQPSLFEGGGHIVEEARALGKTVFLSDIPIHREQNPPEAVYFEPTDAKKLANLIAERWDVLSPGPNLVREREARKEQAVLVLNYARKFVEIAELTAKSHTC